MRLSKWGILPKSRTKLPYGQEETKSSCFQMSRDNVLSKVILVVNVGLLLGKGLATYLTNGSSLSIISTLLDSVVDITRFPHYSSK